MLRCEDEHDYDGDDNDVDDDYNFEERLMTMTMAKIMCGVTTSGRVRCLTHHSSTRILPQIDSWATTHCSSREGGTVCGPQA
eukprot:4933130-Amphidinium_carterae.1